MKVKSTAALAAQAIRTELKANFPSIKFSVRSENYSGGNSIDVNYEDPELERSTVEKLLSKYEYGSFNGMEDYYEITNSRDDIPQVKYLFVNNNWR